MITCVVPLKHLRYAKQRLAGLLQPHERRRICLAMLFDVVRSLKKVPAIGDIRVLTSDPEVETALRARHPDVQTMRDPDRGGLNGALTHAVRALKQEGVSRVLIVPADVPMVEPRDVNEVLNSTHGLSLGIAHDKTGEGTNLLFLSPPSIVDLHFGPRSFEEHVTEARRKGIGYRVFSPPSLLCDVDDPQDIRVLLSRGSSTETYRDLLKLRIDERIGAQFSS